MHAIHPYGHTLYLSHQPPTTCNKVLPENIDPAYTSATIRVSSSLKEQAILKASVRSTSLPLFGTVIVNGVGNAVPSVLRTVKVIIRIVVEGNGSDRYINGSNVMDTLLQTGQTNFDRY